MKLLIVLLALLLTSCRLEIKTDDSHAELEKLIQEAVEEAYFDGQKDAIEGHFHVGFDSETETYFWISSVWEDGREMIYQPTKDEK